MKKIILFLGVLLSMAGCKKVLDLSPLDKLTPSEAFSSERGLILYTNSFYNVLPGAKDIFSADQLSDYSSVNSISTYIQKSGFTPVLAIPALALMGWMVFTQSALVNKPSSALASA